MRETMKRSTGNSLKTAMSLLAVAAMLGLSMGASAQCKPPKQSYQGRCVYPDEIPAVSPPPNPAPKTRAVKAKPVATNAKAPESGEPKVSPSKGEAPASVEKEPSALPNEARSQESGEDISTREDTEAPEATESENKPKARVEQPASRRKTLMLAGFGVAALGVIAGGATGAAALSKDKSLVCPNNLCPPESESDLKAVMGLAHVSTASFVLAGVGATLGVVGLFLNDDPNAAVVMVGPGSFSVQGRF